MYSQAIIITFLKVTSTILAAVIINVILRSLVHVPKHLPIKHAETYVSALRNTISFIVYIITLHYVLIVLGVNITPLLASAGIVGIAVGLGARPLIEDLIAGLFLLSQATIAIGDYVIIDTTEGFIESIGLRTIAIRDEAGALHILPNGSVKTVTNYSRGRTHVYIDIPVKTDQPISIVQSELEKALKKIQEDEKISHVVYPGSKLLGISSFTAGNIMILRIDVITNTHARWEVSNQLRFLVKKGFESKKISFA